MENTDNTILGSIKHLLGVLPDYTVFDVDIMIHINTIIATLTQMGVGPQQGFVINANTTWDEYISPNDRILIEQVKTYIYIRVKMLFDPPTNPSLIEAYKEQAKEFEVRMYTQEGGY